MLLVLGVLKSQQLKLGALSCEASMQVISPQWFLHFPTFGYRDWHKEFFADRGGVCRFGVAGDLNRPGCLMMSIG